MSEKKKVILPFTGAKFLHVTFNSDGLRFMMDGKQCEATFSSSSWLHPLQFGFEDNGFHSLWMSSQVLNNLMKRIKGDKRAWIVTKLCTYFAPYTKTGSNKLQQYLREVPDWQRSLLEGLVRSISGRKLSLMKIREVRRLVNEGVKVGLINKDNNRISSIRNLEMRAMCRRLKGTA